MPDQCPSIFFYRNDLTTAYCCLNSFISAENFIESSHLSHLTNSKSQTSTMKFLVAKISLQVNIMQKYPQIPLQSSTNQQWEGKDQNTREIIYCNLFQSVPGFCSFSYEAQRKISYQRQNRRERRDVKESSFCCARKMICGDLHHICSSQRRARGEAASLLRNNYCQ